jgi:hypothetical protein
MIKGNTRVRLVLCSKLQKYGRASLDRDWKLAQELKNSPIKKKNRSRVVCDGTDWVVHNVTEKDGLIWKEHSDSRFYIGLRAPRKWILYTEKRALKVILPDRETRQAFSLETDCNQYKACRKIGWARSYILYIYYKLRQGLRNSPNDKFPYSGAGIKIRQKMSRTRWGRNGLMYLERRLNRCSGVSKVNPVYGKIRLKSDFSWSRDATRFDTTDWVLCDGSYWDWDRNTTKKWVQRNGKDELMYCVYIYWIVRKSVGLDDLNRIESGASKVNTVYGETHVKVILRDRETRLDTGYWTWRVKSKKIKIEEPPVLSLQRRACPSKFNFTSK